MAGVRTSSKYVHFRTIAPHAKFSTRVRSAYELYTTRPTVGLFAPLIARVAYGENLPQFCIVATLSCFCYGEPYYYMMYSRKNTQGGHVNPRSRVPLYISASWPVGGRDTI